MANTKIKSGDGSRWTTHIPLLVSTALLLAAGSFFFVPLQVYLGNIYEYSIPTLGMLKLLAGWTLAATIVLILPGAILPAGAKRWYCVAIFAVAVASYLQSNLLVWDYGLLDGKELRWEENARLGLLELTVWGVVFAAAVWRRRWVLNHGVVVAIALLGVQGGSAVFALLSMEKAPSHHYYSIDESGLVTFSPEKNLILVLLDAFQSNTFSEILEAEPELREKFRGFVYYPDAVAGYAKTMGSVPNILTGEFYDNSRLMDEHLRESYGRSVLSQMVAKGYHVELYPITDKLVQFDRNVFSNIVPKRAAMFMGPEMASILDISAFRGLPHHAKKCIVSDEAWLVTRTFNAARRREPTDERQSAAAADVPNERWFRDARFRDLDFHSALPAAKISTSTTPRFKFFHLTGPHEPFMYDIDLVPRRLPHGKAGYLRQARGALRVLDELLTTIADLGLEDRTDIIVISDHGGGEYRVAPPGGEIGEGGGTVPAVVRSSGLPLVMMRRAGDSSEFRASGNQVALEDIAPTIAWLAGLTVDEAKLGLNRENPSGRIRRYLHYNFEGWNRRFLPPLVEYQVSGNSWNPESWTKTGREFVPQAPEGARDAVPKATGAGKEWETGIGKDGVELLLAGWAEPEAGFVWSNSERATVRIPVENPKEAAVFEFSVRPFLVPGAIDVQPIDVILNGHQVAQWALDQESKVAVLVPDHLAGETSLTFEFRIPGATSPKRVIAGSNDVRNLGFALSRIASRRLRQFPIDGVLRFTSAGNARTYQLWGWGGPDSSSTWTNGRSAAVAVFVGRQGKPRQLTVKASPYLARGLLPAQRVEIRIDGEVVASRAISGATELTVPLSPSEEGWKVVEFLLPDAAAPIDHPTEPTPDPRFLGLRVESVAIEDQ